MRGLRFGNEKDEIFINDHFTISFHSYDQPNQVYQCRIL